MIKIRCPKKYCRNYANARYTKNRWVHWIDISCNCGYNHRIKELEIDSLQPTSPLFDLVYGTNPFDDYEVKAKQKAKEDEKRKEKLNDKYEQMFKKKEDLKFVKEKVLEEK